MTKPPSPDSKKDSYLLYGLGAILLLLGFVLAYQFVEPAPPTQLKLSTGSPQNTYYRYGHQYADFLARQGVELEVLSSAGSVENLQRLADHQVDIALVQGGIGHADSANLRSLGSLYFEPLWVFYREGIAVERLTDLVGKRIAVGSQGSGTRPVALQLLQDNGISADKAELLALSSQAAAEALAEGSLDALFMVTSPTSGLVRQLISNPSIRLLSFSRASAYQSKHGYLSSVTLPEGVFDLVNNIPDRPISLLAVTATLVVRADFHPALSVLLLQAATKIHGQGGLFEQAGQFPAARFVDFELNEEAERYYRSGPPFLQRYLPFWAANLVDRLVVMLIPIFTLMIPLMKILPPTYRWRIRSRIYRWYEQLRDLDVRTNDASSPAEIEALLQELIDVEHEVMQLPVPKSYADNQYNLRLHLQLIRGRLERKIDDRR
ncbi:MAG: TRAP transporter TAXI family solute receptor [Motiliproteus sp.]|jgi:TRAP transporter TAXI family solute receptor